MNLENIGQALHPLSKRQLLREKNIYPDDSVIKEALKQAFPYYQKFLREISQHEIDLDWRYYHDGNAWLGKGLYRWKGKRGGVKEITVFWLSIWEGYYKVTLFFPMKVAQEVIHLPIDDAIKQLIQNSDSIINQRKNLLVSINLCSFEYLETVMTLIDYKKSLQ